MDRLARAADPVQKRRAGTPAILNRIAVEMGLPDRFAHSLYDDQDQICRDASRRVCKRDSEFAVFGQGEANFPDLAAH